MFIRKRAIFGDELFNYLHGLENYCDELEIALDKACEILENYNTTLFNLTVDDEFRVIKANEWKEYLLNETK